MTGPLLPGETHEPPLRVRARRALLPGGALRENVALECAGGRITRLGRPRGPETELGDGLLLPGLVNAHVHLELSGARTPSPPASFCAWALRLGLRRSLTPRRRLARQARAAVGRLIEEGVTCVGEVATVGASRAALQASGLAGVWYREMISLRPREAPAVLARSLRLAAREAEAAGLRPGLFPHATYSASARLIRASRAEAIRRGLAFAVHASETREEMELFADGTGPLVRLRRLLGRAGRPARECLSPVRWLELAGGLGPRATLVHATHLSDEDLGLVAARGASVVVCPRSSRFFGEGPPEIPRLVRAGVPVGLGTDSPASGGSPSLIEEMRALARMRPSLSPRLILSAATEGGARALGLEADCGALRPGGRADVALADVPPAGDPLEALMDPATRVRGLLVAGRAAPRPPVCLPPAAEPRGS